MKLLEATCEFVGALSFGDPDRCACTLRMKVKPQCIAHFVFFSADAVVKVAVEVVFEV